MPLEANSPTLRAAIYARYSSDMQNPASNEDQIRDCRAEVERRGGEVVAVYKDSALSGASAFRPGYQQMLQDAREGRFDVVMAEALDRLSRDQEDIAALYKRLRFADISIVTLDDREITEMHIGLKGTMNAMQLKVIADKTRRGLRGRVEAGYSGGGISYGYDPVVQVGPDGLPVRGLRRINPDQAAVVRRIFEAYAAGRSGRRIAHALNAEGIPGPRGGRWGASTISGNAARGNGILNNEEYIGKRVWNRQRFIKDPDTGRRVPRHNDATERVVKEVPELRIDRARHPPDVPLETAPDRGARQALPSTLRDTPAELERKADKFKAAAPLRRTHMTGTTKGGSSSRPTRATSPARACWRRWASWSRSRRPRRGSTWPSTPTRRTGSRPARAAPRDQVGRNPAKPPLHMGRKPKEEATSGAAVTR